MNTPTEQHSEITSLSDFLQGWLSGKRATTNSTNKAYQHVVQRYLIPAVGHLPLGQLTHANVESALRCWEAELGATRAIKVMRVFATLRKAFDDAVRQKLISQNPCSSARPSRVRHARDFRYSRKGASH